MDHSSSLPDNRQTWPITPKSSASVRGKDELIEHYGKEFERVETVKTGDEVKLGK